MLAVLLALGAPLSWKKTVLSEINTWLGFVINPVGPFVQMAREKHVALPQDLGVGKVFSAKTIEKALGRNPVGNGDLPSGKTMPPSILAMEDSRPARETCSMLSSTPQNFLNNSLRCPHSLLGSSGQERLMPVLNHLAPPGLVGGCQTLRYIGSSSLVPIPC